MNCLVCQTILTKGGNEYDEYHDSFKAAPNCEINDIYEKHDLFVCDKCDSIHVYCNECKSYAQLTSRYTRIDCSDSNIIAWREDGLYHCSSLNKELSKKYNIHLTEEMNKETDTQIFVNKRITESIDKAHELIYEMKDYLNDFSETLSFMLNDLDIYCLNPNDERLIHPDEKGIAICGTGFNILERSSATWLCKHGSSTIDGHND